MTASTYAEARDQAYAAYLRSQPQLFLELDALNGPVVTPGADGAYGHGKATGPLSAPILSTPTLRSSTAHSASGSSDARREQ